MQEQTKIEENYSKLDLTLKDDFLEDIFFKELHKSIPFKEWDPIENIYLTTGKHIWYSCKVENNFVDFMKEKIENKFNIKIKKFMAGLTYTMVSNVKEDCVHADGVDYPDKDFNTQFILHVRGDNELTNGIGFYVKGKDDTYNLNTHIGFVENRALLFKNKVMHSPLKFLSKNNTPRFSIIGFLSV